jgi:hypothetical protein
MELNDGSSFGEAGVEWSSGWLWGGYRDATLNDLGTCDWSLCTLVLGLLSR